MKAAFAPPGAASDAPQRILVVATRQIGDVLLTTPLIHDTRQRWPQARIEVLGFAGTLAMLAGNRDVDALLETPRRPGVVATLALARRLWRQYDLALVTDGSDRAHLLGWIAARRRSGLLPPSGPGNWWKRRLLQHLVVAAGDAGTEHVTREKQALLPPATTNERLPTPRVLPPAGAPLPPQLRTQLRPGAVVVHPTSMWAYKQWPLAHYEVVVRALLAAGRQVVLTGSSSPRDQECLAALRRIGTAPQLVDCSGQLNFNQLATLLASAALYIGPDTSVTHLAAATGVPVIAIFGPTNPLRWGPCPTSGAPAFVRVAPLQRTGNVTLLQGSLPCVPCARAGCEDHRHSPSACLPDIAPERVLEQAWAVLGTRAPAHA